MTMLTACFLTLHFMSAYACMVYYWVEPIKVLVEACMKKNSIANFFPMELIGL